jgi:hypothetical protein
MLSKLIKVAAVAAIVTVIVQSVPDVKRYIRLRNM